MQFWEDILNTALIGTAKRPVKADAFPEAIAKHLRAAEQNGTGREDLFLKGLSLAVSYRRAGREPEDGSFAAVYDCPPDPLPVCSAKAAVILHTLLNDDEDALVQVWLEACREKKQRVAPRLLPAVFNMAWKHSLLRQLTDDCSSVTGRWLAAFHPDWRFGAALESKEELFHSGDDEARDDAMVSLRFSHPARARELLAASWNGESANMRAKLLSRMQTNLSEDDLEWLESLTDDKSQKVQTVLYNLLKQLKKSAIVEKYWFSVSHTVKIWRERNLLALRETERIEVIQQISIPTVLYESGIVKQSPDKNFTDSEYAYFQVLANVPPSKWEQRLNVSPEIFLRLFASNPALAKYLPAFRRAIVLFSDQQWALAFADHIATNDDLAILAVLPPEEMRIRAMRLMEKLPNETVRFLQQQQLPLPLDLARRIIRHTAKDPYNYNKIFYKALARRLPEEIRFELGAFGPDNAYAENYWKTIREEIEKLLSLKAQIHQAF